MKKKIIYLFICLAAVFTLAACSKEQHWIPDTFDDTAVSDKLTDGVVAENDTYRLEWNSKYCGISLFEKGTGRCWGTTPSREGEPQVDEYGLPVTVHPQLESAIIVKYLNASTYAEEQVIARTGAVNKGRIRVAKIEDGLHVEYYFDEAKIMVPVDYKLRTDSVEISIDSKAIQENENRVTSIAVAPFWCSAKNDSEDSYLFYPSGSGALISCESQSQPGERYTASVYGADKTMPMTDLVTTDKSVRLPVYGAKSGDTAACAIIESSAESADISVIAGAKTLGVSSVYTVFQLRGYGKNTARFLNGFRQKMYVFAKSMIETPLVVGFYPLTGENANYSGMAQVYKDYLKKNGALTGKLSEETDLNVTLIGGAMINKSFLGIPYKELLPATTLKDAYGILEEISAKTDTKLSAKLLGYGKTGIAASDYAGGFQINKNLGTKKDLSSLNRFCTENDISLYMDFDLIKLKESSAGYSNFFDAAYSALYKPAYGYEYDVVTRGYRSGSRYSFLSRELLADGAEQLMKKTKDWELSGVSLSSITNTAYSDYSGDKSTMYYSKGNMAADAAGILKTVSGRYKIAAEDANAYAASQADVIFNTPVTSSGEFIFSEDVPFYQMVYKGYVSMAGESMNMAANPRKQLLRMLESGCGLHYTLTADYHVEFTDSQSYAFFGSQYCDVKDSMFAAYEEVKAYYAAINGAEILSHRILENGVRETVFDNGVTVYVNDSEESRMSPFGEVEASGYIWKGAGE